MEDQDELKKVGDLWIVAIIHGNRHPIPGAVYHLFADQVRNEAWDVPFRRYLRK